MPAPRPIVMVRCQPGRRQGSGDAARRGLRRRHRAPRRRGTSAPYERPPLSKDLLLGKAPRESAFVHEPGWYAEHDVDLRLGTR